MQNQGLHLEQAPPLEIPLAFFLSAPLAAASAGALLIWNGSTVLVTGWIPLTLSLTHLCTLGFLSMVMMGALYQMIPVVAGSPVPWVRLAHAVHVLLVVGVIGLCWGVGEVESAAVFYAISAVTFALLLFLGPVTLALARAPSRNETVLGMGFALACFFVAASVGIWMAHGYGGMRFPGPRDLWIQVHLCVALLGWVGGLISAVSWQVLPMFYLSAEPPRALKWTVQGLIAAGVLLPVLVLCLDYFEVLGETTLHPTRLAALAALPALLSVWALHPAICFSGLLRRRRKRLDGSLLFWRAGLLAAPLSGATAVCAHLLPQPRWALLFVWLALWGWAGMIVHGMLTRIVPFLVWFHRFAPLVGEKPVPSVRGLLPDRWTRRGFAVHLGSVVVGAAAILSGADPLARLTGLLLVATALALGGSLLHVVRQRPE
jgi:hypothetical protein